MTNEQTIAMEQMDRVNVLKTNEGYDLEVSSSTHKLILRMTQSEFRDMIVSAVKAELGVNL